MGWGLEWVGMGEELSGGLGVGELGGRREGEFD
jgi:hypothetical protein